ncbi:extracellular solute-binding protein [Paenibacillus antri]|uniref:Extracellular solute-binding protein n=1 Tax=Paenibacillus antri TaxID=2582848 RepID=A0A5R9G9R7_9BACL|nr:extracellular solute-binding protein [Paenibacillus antri]TLS53187.1 extracellular solute-binding protein [Paenibacillus antri]
MKPSMRKLALVSFAFAFVFASACANEAAEEPADEGQPQETPKTEEPAKTEPETIDPLGKYEPGISMTTARFQRDGVLYPPGDSLDNNVWYRAYEELLGIKLTNNFISSDTPDVRLQKMAVTIASGELPDVIEVNPRELQMLVEADMIEDLTDEWEKYASPYVKEIRASGGRDIAMEAATFGGKLMAIPDGGGSIDSSPMIWVRTDWLKNLGLEPPKTMQDVFAIAEAFTKNDPDKNGQADTFGLALNMNVYDGFAGIEGFMAGFHAYPYTKNNLTMWLKDDSGKLAYGSVQPETKSALQKLNEMFAAGLIDPEFAVKNGTQVAESVTSGKIGLYFGEFWNASWPLAELKSRDANADWMPFPLVSVDAEPAKPVVFKSSPDRYYVVKKGYEHPEALIKMLNLYYEKIYGPNQDPEKFHTVKGVDVNGEKKDVPVFGYAVIRGGLRDNNLQAHLQVTEALKNNDPSKLKPEFKGYYDQIAGYRAGTNPGGWWQERTFGEGGAFDVVNQYMQANNVLVNAFYGTPTETMAQVGATLQQLEMEVFTKIIMGAAPIDDFDKFVADWGKLGGDKITQEVNDWHNSVQ